MDIQNRLKQVENATNKLDVAEARVTKLLGVMDSPETLEKARKKSRYNVNEKTKKAHPVGVAAGPAVAQGGSNYFVDSLIQNIHSSKKDAIMKYKNNGFQKEVIANILEMKPEEVEAVIHYYGKK
jgi:hypothetical protein